MKGLANIPMLHALNRCMHLTTKYATISVLCLCAWGLAQARDKLENDLGMRFVKVPAGTFTMGTAAVEAARMEFPEPKPDDVLDETPTHTVRITQPFYLGETEVTQAVWFRVMENKPGDVDFWEREDWATLPMATASWYMAQRFVEELNKLDTHYRYRLPTEAEWEYAARAGSTGLRPMPEEKLERYAWFINNSGDQPQPVASREANAFGLYDMLGNVWEWVADWYAADTYATSPRDDPAGPAEGFARVRRGGSYHCPIHLLRPGYRAANKPGIAYSVQGFRVVAIERK
ncbi:MAG: formylglycine-generating enzyme family protein [Pseudomonadota bacterium]